MKAASNNEATTSKLPLIFLNRSAFKAFRIWTAAVRREIPDFEVLDVDERELCEDFRKTINEALDAASEEYKQRGDLYLPFYFKGYIHGFVIGNLGVLWSYRYLPAPPYHEYLLWIKSFTMLARVHEETRLRTNRLFVAYKRMHPSLGRTLEADQLVPEEGDYSSHHVLSDLQAPVNWANYESMFDLYFEEDVFRLCDQFKSIRFPENVSLLTEWQLDRLFNYWENNIRNR